MSHSPTVIVAEPYRRVERRRAALIGAWCSLTFAAKVALVDGDKQLARDYATSARELIAMFGQKVTITMEKRA